MPLENANKIEEFTEYKPAPAAFYTGLCYMIADIGTQKTTYKNQPKMVNQIVIAHELHGEDDDGNQILTDDGRPFSTRKVFTLSFGDNAHLTKELTAWRGKPITDEEKQDPQAILKSFLGMPSGISMSHETYFKHADKEAVEKGFPKAWEIAEKGRLVGQDGAKHTFSFGGKEYQLFERVKEVPTIARLHPKVTIPRQHNPSVFFDMGNWNDEVFKNLPQWIRNKIEQSAELKESDSFKRSYVTPKDVPDGIVTKPIGGYPDSRPSNRVQAVLPADFEDSLDDLTGAPF